MASQPIRIQRDPVLDLSDFNEARLGRMVGIDDQGRPFVSFKGGPVKPVIARVATQDPPPNDIDPAEGVPVLLMFEETDPKRPIIVGFVREAFSARTPGAQMTVLPDKTRAIELNGKALIFEGQEEIVLRCGQGSLTIRANGQIVVKGTRLVSRASETNKIRGASVQIN